MRNCLGLICFMFVQFLTAQNITGTLIDSNEEPVVYANVVLSLAKDSSLVKVETTDEQGHFRFHDVSVDRYFVSASYIGLSEYRSDSFHLTQSDSDLGIITMSNDGVELETATVTARRALVEIKPCLLYTSPSPRDS